MPARYHQGSFLTLDAAARLVHKCLGKSDAGGSADVSMSACGLLADDGDPDDDDNCNLSNLLLSGAWIHVWR